MKTTKYLGEVEIADDYGNIWNLEIHQNGNTVFGVESSFLGEVQENVHEPYNGEEILCENSQDIKSIYKKANFLMRVKKA